MSILHPRCLWCFDLDGTLVDIRARYEAVHFDLITALGGRPLPDYYSRRLSGLSELEAFNAAGLLPEQLPNYDFVREELLEESRYLKLDSVLPGTHELLHHLQNAGAEVWIITHRTYEQRLAEELVDLGVSELVTGWICTKPYRSADSKDPLALSAEGQKASVDAKAKVLSEFQTQHSTVMVGDSPSDVLAAKQAGVTSVAIPTGLHHKESLLRVAPDYLADTLDALYRRLRKTDEALQS